MAAGTAPQDTAEIDIDHLRQWIGRTETAEDTVSIRLASGYMAVMDDPAPDRKAGDLAPLAIHWCLAPAIAPMGQLGPDGHPRRGGLLPPVPLAHRMWAGGRLDLHDRFRVGDRVTRQSVVRDVAVKSGRSGALCFVTVDHKFFGPQGLLMSERHDIVYRGPSHPDAPVPAVPQAPTAQWSRSVMADPVLLFRYSALTFNGHRIHYDRNHAVHAEGYAGLVVHGPLQATLMLEFAANLKGTAPNRFDFRAVSPLTDGAAFTMNAAKDGDALHLWIAASDGRLTMDAHAFWA